MEALIQVQSSYFAAGVVLEGKTVTMTAPILHYMKGWDAWKVAEYCKKKRWKIVRVY